MSSSSPSSLLRTLPSNVSNVCSLAVVVVVVRGGNSYQWTEMAHLGQDSKVSQPVTKVALFLVHETEAFHRCGTTVMPPAYSHGHHHGPNMVFSFSSNGSHHLTILTQRESPRTNRSPNQRDISIISPCLALRDTPAISPRVISATPTRGTKIVCRDPHLPRIGNPPETG